MLDDRLMRVRLCLMRGRAARHRHDLTTALGQVGFELQMMASTTARLNSDVFVRDGIAWNAYLESSYLHARALIHFFVKDSS